MQNLFIFGIFFINFVSKSASTECEELAAKIELIDQTTIAETSIKMLSGIWSSEACETRPGPEYVLRYYIFNEDSSYILTQHHYWDDSCSSPKLTVQSYGKIQLRSPMFQIQSASGSLKVTNISVTAQDENATKELEKKVSTECPGQTFKSWKKYEEHTVYDSRYDESNRKFKLWLSAQRSYLTSYSMKNGNVHRSDLNCLGSLRYTFNELKLLKVQLRPIIDTFGKTAKREVKMELLLGDIHSNPGQRQYYNPSSFQVPLVKHIKESEEIIVNYHTYIVRNVQVLPQKIFANPKSPPHLNEKPHLPPYIWGQWTSSRCESRSGGSLYLIRKFSFYSKESSWIGEHKFYIDPFCKVLKFIVTAAGHLMLYDNNNEALKEAKNIDFLIEKVSIIVRTQKMITEMKLNGHCGFGEWQINVPKEISTTGGCIQLGLIIPSTHYDIVKVEMDFKGNWLLFLGQVDTDNIRSKENFRPTAFQLPLEKCGEMAYSENFWDILTGNLEPSHNDGTTIIAFISRIIFFCVINLAAFLV